MTHLLKIIHRPFSEQFHAGTFFSKLPKKRVPTQKSVVTCTACNRMIEEKEETSKQRASNTKAKDINCPGPKEEFKTVITLG